MKSINFNYILAKNTNYIKTQKPRKNSRFHQGMIDPNKLKKYYDSCKNDPIIYRSGLEYQFIQYCENSPSVAKWASEVVKIPYYSHLDQKECNYYPDYVIENSKGVRCIVELKPFDQTIKPDMMASKWAKEQWIKNVDKWHAAKKFCDENGLKFIIVTEKFFE